MEDTAAPSSAMPDARLAMVKDFTIGRGRRDRNTAIAPSILFELCMETRLAGNREAIHELLGGRYVIKAQSLRFHHRLRHLFEPLEVRVSQSIGNLGNSSFEYLYSIYCEQPGKRVLLATAVVVCVAVRAPGEKLPLPPNFRRIASAAQEARMLEDSRRRRDSDYASSLLSIEMDSVPTSEGAINPRASAVPVTQLSLVTSDGVDYFAMPVLLRPSDEDWNHHVNNVSYVRFFEDALEIVRELAHVPFGARDVDAMAIDYLRECSIRVSNCRVLVRLQPPPPENALEDGSQATTTSLPSLAFLFQGREADGKTYIYARGRVVAATLAGVQEDDLVTNDD
ncbi:uncharacterized protein MONBRDRAFT_10077 [Monosiga brevicollis MX1]|uniref:Acyl-ACP thioesterase-like C-terminal domain-containing protein n=1 Tax=Monosiga brevicollis TaxID=81824 RepID=A9V555_MONBE|nr:uncharacterized protein MONBRDRAFT_10077 [Monosiga brevicollis MX1]EDQ87320.1 predicted protein [Monosiga brevicollis MX1]|eukprot:XP_001747933.1 hypothetical protein [Monosiga brevicollis MX1]